MVPEPLQPEGGDDLIDRLLFAALGPAGPGQPQRGREDGHLGAGVLAQQEHVEDREFGKEPAVLEGAHHPDPEPLLGQVLAQVDAVEAHRAGLGGHETRDDIEGRRLPRAVGADQPDDLTRLGPEGHTVEGVDAAEVHGQPIHRQLGRVARRRDRHALSSLADQGRSRGGLGGGGSWEPGRYRSFRFLARPG